MATVNLFEQSGKSVLSTRPSARAMESAMRAASGDGAITMDTSGVLRIGVSFFDEALLIFDEIVRETGNNNLRLIFPEAPGATSLKELALHRSCLLVESPSGKWIISRLELA